MKHLALIAALFAALLAPPPLADDNNKLSTDPRWKVFRFFHTVGDPKPVRGVPNCGLWVEILHASPDPNHPNNIGDLFFPSTTLSLIPGVEP